LPHQGQSAKVTPLSQCERGVAAKAAGVSVKLNRLYQTSCSAPYYQCLIWLL